MSHTDDVPRQYPVVCPICDEVKGFPYPVTTLTDQAGSIEIKLRCRECHHEWVEIVSSSG